MALDLNIQEKFNIQDLKEILKTEFKDFITITEENSLVDLDYELSGIGELYIQELGYTEDEASQIELGAIEFYTHN